MRLYGFSTGALALGDFSLALSLLEDVVTNAIELSALRLDELVPLVQFVETAQLSRFSFISVHAPTRFPVSKEKDVVRELKAFQERGWPIVVHPDAIHNHKHWEQFGDTLLVENMDRRKPVGRTTTELSLVFGRLPNASLCFDIAHARQFDTSMTEAYKILRDHSERIRQIHFSEVNTSSKHDVVSAATLRAYQELSGMIPPQIPIILETPARKPDEMKAQLELAVAAFEHRSTLIEPRKVSFGS